MNPPADDITLGELARGIAALEGRINGQFGEIGKRLDNLQFVPRGEHDLAISQLRAEIDELKDGRRWISRTLVAAFLFPLLVAVMVALVIGR